MPEEITQEQREEMEAAQFLEGLTTTTSSELTTTLTDDQIIEKNNKLIEMCNNFIVDRIESQDPWVKVSEVTSAKDTAFKQNQLLKGKATDNINLNVNELREKNPDELLALLKMYS